MTARKLRKYLSKPLPPLEGQNIITPIILTHREVRYLKDICKSQIIWRYKLGQLTEVGYNWLQNHISREIEQFDNIHLYMWLGTCDFTVYDGRFVTLVDDTEAHIKALIDNHQKYCELMKVYPARKITFS